MDWIMYDPYFKAVAGSIVSYVFILLLKYLFCHNIDLITKRTKNDLDDSVAEGFKRTKQWFMISSAIYIGSQFLPNENKYATYTDKMYLVLLMLQLLIWGNRAISVGLEKVVLTRSKKNPAAASSLSLLTFVSKLIFFAIAILFTLTNLDIKVTPIVAGLGVGGVAVALAVQNILGDLFSSLTIVLDKPFTVGDFIVLGEWQGTVEKIGLKSTRIRSLSGEQVILANSDLLQSRIRNYKRMNERRVEIDFPLPYGTSVAKIKQAISIITKAIESEKHIRIEYCHLSALASSAINIETVYWVTNSEFAVHMRLQEQLLLKIYEGFNSSEITFALPAQMVYFKDAASKSTSLTEGIPLNTT